MMRRIVLLACIVMCGLLTVFSPSALQAARNGFSLFLDTVLPALLPYFVCTSLISLCGVQVRYSRFLLPALALVSGAPSGARCAAILSDDDKLASRLAAALNAASPAFIAGVFCSGCMGVPRLAVPMLTAQYLSALVMLVPLIPRIRGEGAPAAPPAPTLAEAVRSAMSSLTAICGTIVFFCVLIKLADITGLFDILCYPFLRLTMLCGGNGTAVKPMVTGIFEMVTGANAVAAARLDIRAAAALGTALFSFGGLCVMAQSEALLKIKPGIYLLSKLVQSVIAGIAAYLITPLFDIPQAVISLQDADTLMKNASVTLAILVSSLIGMSAVLLLAAAASGVRRREQFHHERQ